MRGEGGLWLRCCSKGEMTPLFSHIHTLSFEQLMLTFMIADPTHGSVQAGDETIRPSRAAMYDIPALHQT